MPQLPATGYRPCFEQHFLPARFVARCIHLCYKAMMSDGSQLAAQVLQRSGMVAICAQARKLELYIKSYITDSLLYCRCGTSLRQLVARCLKGQLHKG